MGKNIRNTKNYKNGQKNIRIIPFTGEKEKWRMWSGKFMARSGIKEYHVFLTGTKIILSVDEDKIQEREIAEFKLLNFTAYNELILSQEDTVCFQIIEEANTEANKYGDAILAWPTLSRKF